MRVFPGSIATGGIYFHRHHCGLLTWIPCRVLGGRVLAQDPSYRLNGEVASGGMVRVTVSAGGQSAGGFGHLSRDSGAGSWRTPPGQCSGQWTAARRD